MGVFSDITSDGNQVKEISLFLRSSVPITRWGLTRPQSSLLARRERRARGIDEERETRD